MDTHAAIAQIEDACKTISLAMMKVVPAARHLGDETVRDEVMKSAHQLTVELEVIKKKMIRLKGRDESALL
ncbi:MAG: hypothetical protein JNK37_21125 [Verrucomicrobiales bacterium]|nr:hypothetical protein [Verrucomicrobiales bacterium]